MLTNAVITAKIDKEVLLLKIEDFNTVIQNQIAFCLNTLTGKGAEYAPDAVKEPTPLTAQAATALAPDRLEHFKKAAAIMNTTPKAALLGMLSKHIISVSDMCTDNRKYPVGKWEEKITDSINYLLILRAIVEEENE